MRGGGCGTSRVDEGVVPVDAVRGDGHCHLKVFQESLAFLLLPRSNNYGVAVAPKLGGVDPIRLGEPNPHQEMRDWYETTRLHEVDPRVVRVVGPQLRGVRVSGVGSGDRGRGRDSDHILEEVECPRGYFDDVPLVPNQLPLDSEEFIDEGGVVGREAVLPAK